MESPKNRSLSVCLGILHIVVRKSLTVRLESVLRDVDDANEGLVGSSA